MNDALLGPPPDRRRAGGLRDFLPRGNTLSAAEWRRRHRLLEWVLLLHVPVIVGIGVALGRPASTVAAVTAGPLVCLVLGHVVPHRRWASFLVTGGLVLSSAAFVLLGHGAIEAHFHFFIVIGFIALYQDWVPFLGNAAFVVLSHGLGTAWLGGDAVFNHAAAQAHPWLWSLGHGAAVLLACIGIVIFWRFTEDDQAEKELLGRRLLTADSEINRRQFTSDMLVNLARRNQSMLYRQLDIINQLEDSERDPDALADLFRLDHLATRIRRNAESLLVLAGEQTPRTWAEPVLLRDVVRAAIAETEDLDRVVFAVDDRVAVAGASVADLTHLLAELTENAVRFSPPETAVTIRARPDRRDEGGLLLTVEDWGVGMPPDDLARANELLASPQEVDLAVSKRLGFHVVSRLAARHGIAVSLGATPGSGITALVVLPSALFTPAPGRAVPSTPAAGARATVPAQAGPGQVVAAERPAAPAAGSTRRDPAWTEPTPAGAADAWVTPEPFAPEPTVPAPAAPTPAGPGPGGRWRGWWAPEAQAPNGARDPGPAGVAVNGHVVNGHGGPAPVDAAREVDGRPAAARPVEDGPGRPALREDDHAAPAGTAAVVPAGAGPDPAGPGTPAPVSGEPDGAAADAEGAEGSDAEGPETGVPDAGGPDTTVPAAWEPPAAPVVPLPVGGPRSVGPGRAAAPPTPSPRPAPGPRPDGRLPAPAVAPRPVPLPPPPARGGGAGTAGPPAPRAPRPIGPRTLRRRVPQSHLAPELRQAHQQGGRGPADVGVPMSADAAATALSRYQASRQAAQAALPVLAAEVADGPGTDEGGRG